MKEGKVKGKNIRDEAARNEADFAKYRMKRDKEM